MAALRYAARRLVVGQPRQPIYRAAVAEEQRRLLPSFIHGGSSAYPRRFISIQPHEEEQLTFEEKWRISKRVAHMIYRTAKAVSIMVASGMIIELSVNELFAPGNLLRETASLANKCQDMLRVFRDNPREANADYVMKNRSTAEVEQELESVMAEFESALKNANSRVLNQRLARHEDNGFRLNE